ncbi:MAG: leader peptidase (prepilin peptidase)/N-methyltransferase, partial [Glaciecola sp.]
MLSDFLIEYPLYFYLFVGALGLIVGSFLNVVILRLPEMMQREWRCDCRALLELEDDEARDGAEKLSLSF